MTAAGTPPVAPAQGIAVAPVALAASTLATIPLPTLPTGRAPVPWRTPWVTILNSSPFTLVVSSGGGVVTQIAAFTSDKVFVQATGGALVTVLPVPGSGTVASGQDSTAYATWYAEEPPGQYPAALGSGAANFALTSTIVAPQNLNTVGGGTPTTFGPFTTTGFGGLALVVSTNGIAAPTLQVTVEWLDSTDSVVIGARFFVLPAQTALSGGRLQVSLANRGPRVRIRVVTTGIATPYSIAAVLNTQPIEGFTGVTGFGNLLGDGVLLIAVNNVQVVSIQVYGGPATLTWECTSGFLFDVLLEAQDPTLTWRNLLHVTHAQPPTGSLPIILPTNPLRLTTTLVTPSAAVINAALLVDSMRVG